MKLPQAETAVLRGGLRHVHIRHRSTGAGIFGIVVLAGSSDESADEEGLAHFVEHTIFKGTRKRSSWHIINRMEAVGGELNAFTTKEETTVYSIFPSGNAARAVELIADLALNSVFPAKELEKEREVVLDEIYSYRDTPSDAVFDDFEDLVYAGSPLGHNILGTPDSVRKLESADCRRFLDRYYNAANIVTFYSGPESLERIFALVERHFAAIPEGEGGRRRTAPQFIATQKTESFTGLHQAHVLLGIPVSNLYDDRRFADALFANLIGGPGMNSLLNVELRERRGLVYNVEASASHLSDTGFLTVYFGCDADDTDRCLKICRDTLLRLADMPVAELERILIRAKRQYMGQRAVASENRENRVMACARTMLYRGQLPSDDVAAQQIRDVTADEIRSLAARLSTPSSLIFMPETDA